MDPFAAAWALRIIHMGVGVGAFAYGLKIIAYAVRWGF